jgi:hypothetical protein
MKISLDSSRVELRRHQTLRLADASGVAVVCLCGALWITQENDPRDVIVEAGAWFALDRPGVALVEAIEASSVHLRAPRPVELHLPAMPGALARRFASA